MFNRLQTVSVHVSVELHSYFSQVSECSLELLVQVSGLFIMFSQVFNIVLD